MKRLAVLAALAVLLACIGAASSGGAQDAEVSIVVTSVYTSDYPADPNPITVCLEGEGPQVLTAGESYSIVGSPGIYKFKIFDNGSAACSDVPDDEYETSVYAGDHLGLVLGSNLAYTFAYDDACVAPLEARLLVASGLYIGADVYLTSDADGQTTPFATGLIGGVATDEVTAGTYDVIVVNEGDDPDGPRLATIPDVYLTEGTATQLFLAGGSAGETGGFYSQQDPKVCEAGEPEPEATSSTTTSTTTASTATTSTVAPAAASAATPVSGTATFTG